jgi:protocatechuate 3,4-dioxygenase beta subunit
MHDHDEDHHRGLAFDMSTLLARRGMLGLLGGAAMIGLVGCGSDEEQRPASGSTAARSGTATAGEEIPGETAGPYPGDGSNGPNILTRSGIVRSDIRPSFGSASAVAAGVPLSIELTVTDGGAAYRGAAVYLWHCDRGGRYSMYSEGVTGENYLRGVQEADANGVVRFISIFPAAYSGRWPHIHFEVYSNLDQATSAAGPVKTSQLAFPENACATVYATSGYEQSVTNLKQTSLAGDNVFGDGCASQLAGVTGSVSSGYTAKLAMPV